MSPRRIALTLALAVLAVAAPATPAPAVLFSSIVGGGFSATPVSFTAVGTHTTGELTVSFHGDARSGCAALGVCGYAGTIVWHPSGGNLLIEKFRHGRRLSTDVSLNFDQGSGTAPATAARVIRTTPGARPGGCADLQSPPDPRGITLKRGMIRLRLLTVAGSLLSTRCAGPLDADLAGIGPTAALSLAAIHQGTRVDLREARSFTGHGFSGTIDSTIVMRLGKPQTARSAQRVSPRKRTRRFRIVSEHLTLVGGDGQLQGSFRGVSDPTVCGLLDSCGLTGSLGLTATARPATATLNGFGPASRPYADYLSALGLSRSGRAKGIQISGGLELAVNAPRTNQNQGGARCADTGTAGRALVLFNLQHSLLSAGLLPEGPTRTRCPGPTLAAGGAPLLTGSIPVRDVTRRSFALRLDHPMTFEDDGYQGRIAGGLTLVFRRGGITQQVIPLPGF